MGLRDFLLFVNRKFVFWRNISNENQRTTENHSKENQTAYNIRSCVVELYVCRGYVTWHMKNLKNIWSIGKKRTDRLLLCGVLGEKTMKYRKTALIEAEQYQPGMEDGIDERKKPWTLELSPVTASYFFLRLATSWYFTEYYIYHTLDNRHSVYYMWPRY